MTAVRSLASAVAATLLAAAAHSQSFGPGELWIVSQSMPHNSTTTPGISRVDLLTGTAQFVLQGNSFLVAASSFDLHRNGIVVGALMPGMMNGPEIIVVKANGTFTSLNTTAAALQGIAATGDGRIYFYRNNENPSILRYIDSANVVHPLLDATGTAPFSPSTNNQERAMFYDAVTNSLFIGTTANNPCGTGFTSAVVEKVPLSADGTKVAGPMQSANVCAVGATSDTKIVNFNEGPNGTIFAVIDDNSNDAVGRMITIDRTTLAVTKFASNGPYTGAAATVAGVYSRLFSAAIIDDGLIPALLVYPKNSSSGTPTATGDGISFNADTMIHEIPNAVAAGLFPYGTGTPGCNGTEVLFANGTPKVGSPNFRFTCTNARPSALGLLVVGNVPDFLGTDVLALGVLFHVNVFSSTFFTGLDMSSSGFGLGVSTAPIPLSPSLAGQTVVAQAIWTWSGCSTPSPFGISASTGLAVVFQP